MKKLKLKKGFKILLYIILIVLFILFINISIQETSKKVTECEQLGLTVRECQNLRG